jgi:repressor of nif and glnA expression
MAQNVTSVLVGILQVLSEFGPSTDWQIVIRLLTKGYTTSEQEVKRILQFAKQSGLINYVKADRKQPLAKYHLSELGRNLVGLPPEGEGSTLSTLFQ